VFRKQIQVRLKKNLQISAKIRLSLMTLHLMKPLASRDATSHLFHAVLLEVILKVILKVILMP